MLICYNCFKLKHTLFFNYDIIFICRHQTVRPSTVVDTPIWEIVSQQSLVELWQNPCPHATFMTNVHINQFFKVSLKSVCLQCRAPFAASGCTAPACHNTEQSVIHTRLRWLDFFAFCISVVQSQMFTMYSFFFFKVCGINLYIIYRTEMLEEIQFPLGSDLRLKYLSQMVIVSSDD